MKFGNPLAAALVITAATVLIVSYALHQPHESALLIIIVYIATIIFLSITVYFISKMYSKHKSSVDPEDFIGICEDLNTEIAIWSDDFSLIVMNKKLRDLIGVDYEKYDKKEALFTGPLSTGREVPYSVILFAAMT